MFWRKSDFRSTETEMSSDFGNLTSFLKFDIFAE